MSISDEIKKTLLDEKLGTIECANTQDADIVVILNNGEKFYVCTDDATHVVVIGKQLRSRLWRNMRLDIYLDNNSPDSFIKHTYPRALQVRSYFFSGFVWNKVNRKRLSWMFDTCLARLQTAVEQIGYNGYKAYK